MFKNKLNETKSRKAKLSTQTMAVFAILIAAQFVISQFLTFQVWNIKIGFSFVPVVIAARLYGAIGAAIATGISYLVFFWTRTLISRKLWYKFKLKKFIVITIILLGISLINCIIKNIYMITAINIIGIGLVLCNYRNLIHKMLIYLKNKKIQKENKKI